MDKLFLVPILFVLLLCGIFAMVVGASYDQGQPIQENRGTLDERFPASEDEQ